MTDIVAEIHAALDWLAATDRRMASPARRAVRLVGRRPSDRQGLAIRSVVAGLAISGIFELGPMRDTYLNDKLRLTETKSLRCRHCDSGGEKPLAIAYGTAELPPLVSDSRDLHAKRAAAHCTGSAAAGAGADHFTIVHELRDADGG